MIVILARPPRCSLYTSNSRSAMATTTRRAAVRIRTHRLQVLIKTTRKHGHSREDKNKTIQARPQLRHRLPTAVKSSLAKSMSFTVNQELL